ncbi:MAG: hypothetical protein Q9212_002670 [Teloschistes hypoglaucus]
MASLLGVFLVSFLLPYYTFSSPVAPVPNIWSFNEIDDANYFGWIESWSAIGDSYAAGFGVGPSPGTSKDGLCSRYGHAYPHLLNDLMDNKRGKLNFLACTGATTTEVKDQAKTLGTTSQDLLTISAGANDVGFSTVLKKCVYLTGTESGCDSALDAASSLIKNKLRANIEDLLASALPVMKEKGVVVYTLYAKFFNAVATGCNKVNWVLFDPTLRKGTNRGLKLTTRRREKMNRMVDAANQQIRTAIENSRPAFEARGISILVADWDEYVGRINGRFCEEGAPANPDDNFSLVFQRQDNTPQFIRPEELLAGNPTAFQSHTASRKTEHLGLTKRSIFPDAWTRVFHPNFLGQSIIAQITLSQIAKNRATRLGSDKKAETSTLYPGRPTCKEDLRTAISHPKYDEAVLSFCKNKQRSTSTTIDSKTLELGFSPIEGTTCYLTDCAQSMYNLYEGYPTRKFPPGPTAVDSAASLIEPVCFMKQHQFVQQPDLDAAIASYCDNDGKAFFKGDKQLGHAISNGLETHIYTEGTDISRQSITYYKYDDVCEYAPSI